MDGVPAPQRNRKTDPNSRIVGRSASFQKSRTQRLPGYSGSVLSLLLPNKGNLERRPPEILHGARYTGCNKIRTPPNSRYPHGAEHSSISQVWKHFENGAKSKIYFDFIPEKIPNMECI